MANENLKRMLEISKRVDNNTSSGNGNPQPRQRKMSLEEQINSYDKQVFGKYIPSEEEQKEYSAEAEMKLIKERSSNPNSGGYNHNTKVPNSILESILSNPCDLDANLYEDSNMTEFTKRLSQRIPGIKNVQDIQKKLDESDKQKQETNIVETKNTVNNANAASAIDYSLIKTIVESVISDKLNDIQKTLLNENTSHNSGMGNLRAMKMSDKFLFLDDNNNVYECQMKYIGKNKKK